MQHQGELSAASMSELLDFALEAGAMAVWEWHVQSGALLLRAAPALDFGRGPTRAAAWMEQLHPLDREPTQQRIDACLSGKTSSFELLLRIRDGEGGFRWLRSEGRVADRDDQGVPTRFVGITQDVHRLRMIEDTLRRNAELFGKIPDSIVCTDLEGTITYWNQGATELYGWTADDMLGKHISARFPASAREEVGQIHAQLSAGGEFSSEFLDYRKDGSRVWVDARIARYGSASAPAGIMGFAHDVTKRRATQEMLLRDATILSQLQDIVVCLDLERRVTYWNDAAERILGWKREEMLGRLIHDRLPPSVAEEVDGNMDMAMAGHPAPPSEWQDYRKDGSRVWVAWRSETLRDSDGKVVGITAVGSDITERRRVEEERKKLENQLFHAQKMESLGTMAGGIAHDFNNTLAVVLVYSELALASHHLDPSLREGLEQIQRAGTRARDLVARILTFSRTQDLQRTNVELGVLLLDYEKLVRATLPATVQLRVTVGLCGSTLADANQLHQVLLNLCGNAAQAMDDSGILSIALSQQWSPERSLASGMISAGNYAVIEVTDNGRGMSPDTQTRIFEPFFTTKPVGKGTGLGLATAVAIVRNHGGGIDVQSRLGAGSSFRVYLPVAHSAPAAAGVALNAPPSGQGQRVLIVDDEEPVAILTRTALQSLGYYAESVFSPEVFLDRFLQAPDCWDLLITDQTMPRVTGIELARQLRNLGHEVPILIATGFSRQLTPEALRKLGSSTVLRKPFDIDDLARVVGTALLSRPASAAASERA